MTVETSISLASAVIAIAALFVSTFNAWATRRHHRLSVKPHLTLLRWISAYKAPYFKITLTNNGLGPALITSIRVFVDDVVQPLTRPEHWRDIISKLRRFNREATGGFVIEGETALRPGVDKELVWVHDISIPSNEIELSSEISRVRIEVEYSSVYGEKFKEILGK